MSELRKSLDSIQSLLSQAKSPSSISGGNAYNNNNNGQMMGFNQQSTQQFATSPSQDIFRRASSVQISPPANHPPAAAYTSTLSYSRNDTPAASRNYGSNLYEADTPATHATALAPHHPLYQQEQSGQHAASSASSSSLCNHFTSPYNKQQAVRPFSSDEHGGVIGSPLSAFEEFKRSSTNGEYVTEEQRHHHASNEREAGRAVGRVNFQENLPSEESPSGIKGRETSLLISPMETPGTVRQLASPLNGIKTSLYHTSNAARDPTPYHYRGQPSHIDETAAYYSGGGNSGSSRESRSGLDPPAKSPFAKHAASVREAAREAKEEEHLSIIRENNSYDSKYEVTDQNNASITSEVTGFTTNMPRTPLWRSANTPATARSKTSVATSTIKSPSDMDERLHQIASCTRSKLDSLWDKIGVHPDERYVHLTDLVSTFETICNEKIEEEEGLVSQFIKDIEDLKEEYERSCIALGLENEIQLRRDPSGKDLISLQCEYEAVFGRVESVRGAVALAKEDLEGSRSRIFEAYVALNGDGGDDGELEEWRDVETDLTERRREEFRAKAVELEEAVVSRTKAVISLTRDCQSLLREMEIVNGDGFGDEVVGNNQDDVKIMNSLVMHDDAIQSPHDYRSRSSDRFDIASLVETPTCMGISSSALERLTRRIAELNDEKKKRRMILAKMGSAIQSLWLMLRVPEEEQKAFSSSIKGLSLETIRIGEKELARLNERKAVMVGKLIREKRQEIEKLWEQTNTPDAEKASFDCYFHIYDDDKLTEDLLTTHQEYASILNEKLEKMRPILDLIAKREDIVSERFELEQLQKDPDRLKGRHACQQLAKEEKMHRRVKNELPRITAHLEKTLQAWYHDNRPSTEEEREADPTLGHFIYQGAPYLETMHTQEHDWRMRKEIEEQDRKNKRDEERKAKGNNFGSSFTKLPGQKYKPSIGSTNSSSTSGSRAADSRPRSASNVRAASNTRGGPRAGPPRPLADVSGSRGNVPRPPSRSRQGGDKSLVGRINNNSGYRATSAPRQRF
ncbi:hypothetical protein ACHAXN_004409 [Cyclotella atomus]